MSLYIYLWFTMTNRIMIIGDGSLCARLSRGVVFRRTKGMSGSETPTQILLIGVQMHLLAPKRGAGTHALILAAPLASHRYTRLPGTPQYVVLIFLVRGACWPAARSYTGGASHCTRGAAEHGYGFHQVCGPVFGPVGAGDQSVHGYGGRGCGGSSRALVVEPWNEFIVVYSTIKRSGFAAR